MTTPFALEMAELSGVPVSPEELEMLAKDRYPSDEFIERLTRREVLAIDDVHEGKPGALRLLAGVQFVKNRMRDWRFEEFPVFNSLGVRLPLLNSDNICRCGLLVAIGNPDCEWHVKRAVVDHG